MKIFAIDMVVKCGACRKYVSAVEGASVPCSVCKKTYHKDCVGLNKNNSVLSTWACPECKSRLPRSNQDSTPVKKQDSLTSPLEPPCPELPTTSAAEEKSEEISLAYELRAFRLEMARTREEVKGLREDLYELRSSVRACESRLDKVEESLQGMLEERESVAGTDSGIAKVVQALEENMLRLRHDLNERDQELLLNEIEMSGVPEENGENPVHIVLACAAKLGLQLDEHELVTCARVGVPRREAGSRPRPIALRLTRRDTRDALLRAARVRRHLTTEGWGLKSEPRPCYINERLTYTNRHIFFRARQAASRLQWRYVWTKDGRIYVRRETGAPAHRIRCEADLVKAFGPDSVRSLAPES